MELGDHKWGLDHNGEKVETIYGDQNFVHHKVESTYLECLKDRNVWSARCAMSWEHRFLLSHIGDKTLVG